MGAEESSMALGEHKWLEEPSDTERDLIWRNIKLLYTKEERKTFNIKRHPEGKAVPNAMSVRELMAKFDMTKSGIPPAILVHHRHKSEVPAKFFDPMHTFPDERDNAEMAELRSSIDDLEPIIVLENDNKYYLLSYREVQQRFAAAYWARAADIRVFAIPVEAFPAPRTTTAKLPSKTVSKRKTEPAIEVIPKEIELYHGSQRLYSITCYIRRQKPMLFQYVRDVRANKFTTNVAPKIWQQLMARALEKYDRFMYPTVPKMPWTIQVFILYAITKMYETKQVFLISEALKPLIEAEIENPDRIRSALHIDYLYDITTWLEWIEEKEDDNWEHLHLLLNVEYFSVMRQDVQFFSNAANAMLYAQDDDKLFQFIDREPLKLVNISDPDTIVAMTFDDMPFASWIPYSRLQLANFTEQTDLTVLRHPILVDLFANWYFMAAHPRVQRLETELSQLQAKWEDLYAWKYPSRKKIPFEADYLPIYLEDGKKSWPDLVREIVEDARQHQKDTVWKYLVETAPEQPGKSKYEAVVADILRNWPDEKAILEDLRTGFIDTFLDRMNGARNFFVGAQEYKWQTDIENERIRGAKKMIADLSSVFHAKGGQSTLNNMIATVFRKRDVSTKEGFTRLAGALVREWEIYFEHELISPRGLWNMTHWRTLFAESFGIKYHRPELKKPQTIEAKEGTEMKFRTESYPEPRISYYHYDTLLVYTLHQSAWAEKAKINGWICHNPPEIVVFNPSTVGTMVKVNANFKHDSPACIYEA